MIRALQGIEKAFVIPDSSEFMQLALKFASSAIIPKVVSNIQKMFKIALQTRVENDAFYPRDNPPSLIKIPNWITDCESACTWISDNHTLPLSTGLGTIAANDEIVAINTSHIVGDGGFMKRAILNCTSDHIEEPDLFPTPMRETYKPELERAGKLKPALFPYQQCSSFFVDPRDPHLAPKGTHCIYWRFRLPANRLSCFDRKRQKLTRLSDAIWTSTTLAIGTLGKSVETLAIPVIVDLRKYVDPSRLNNTCLNNEGSANIAVKTSPNMKLSEIGEKFRADFTRYEDNMGIFYSTISDDYWISKPGNCQGNSSNLGAIALKPPLKDFYVNTSCSGYGINNMFFIFTFSKVTPLSSELRAIVRFSPTSITTKMAHIVTESIKHSLTTIPMETTFREAHQEIQAFQAKLEKEY
jgi:hypothetical protein